MIRIALTSTSLLFLVTLAGGAAYWWDLIPGTAISPQASRERVFEYLVTKDLRSQDKELRGELIDRLQAELLSQPLESSESPELTIAQTEQLNANLKLLEEEWFWRRVRGYQHVSATDRSEYLLSQIELVSLWGELAAGGKPASADSDFTGQVDPLDAFIAKMEAWVAKVSPAEQADAWLAVEDAVTCWLANEDVAEMDLATRQTLARNIALNLSSLSQGSEITAFPVSAEQEMRLIQNGKLLMEAWMLEKANAYAKISGPEQLAFVDALIAEISSWEVLGRLFGGSTGTELGLTLAQVSEITKETKKWVERAESPQREQLQELLTAVQTRLITKRMNAMFGS